MPDEIDGDLEREMLKLSAKLHAEGTGHVVNVSAGALTLLVTFRGAVLQGAHSNVWALKLAWVCLAGAVIAVVVGKMVGSDVVAKVAAEDSLPSDAWIAITEWIPNLGVVLFSVAMIGLTWFGLANL